MITFNIVDKETGTDREIKAWRLACTCLMNPWYRVLLCADRVLPPSPWTDKFRIEVDRMNKVIRLSGDFI